MLVISNAAVMIFENAVGYLVGEENRGLETMFIMMNAARFGVGLEGVAIAERAFQRALAFSKERLQGRDLVAGGKTVAPGDGTAHFGLVVNNDDPPPCIAGYGGTNKRQPSVTGPASVNTGAYCGLPRGSKSTVAPWSAAISAERSVEPLSTTITSPERPECAMPSQVWSTTVPTAASSSRQGRTTEIWGAGGTVKEYACPPETP